MSDGTKEAMEKAIDTLAESIEYGHLLAQTDPAQMLINAAREIKRLRDALEAVRKIERITP